MGLAPVKLEDCNSSKQAIALRAVAKPIALEHRFSNQKLDERYC